MAPVPITDINAVVDAIVGYCTTAGTALVSPITNVSRGVAIPDGPCIRVWYGGETDPTSVMGGSRVLNGELIGVVVHITAFWPVQGASGAAASTSVDKDVVTLAGQLRTLILGNSTLGGICTDLELAHMSGDIWDLIDGTQWRTLEATVNVSYAEYATNP